MVKHVQVYAIDLLGFGDSEKALLDYSIDLWKEQVLDFIAAFIDKPTVLVGNSIGSLVSLAVMNDAGGDVIRGADTVKLRECASLQEVQHDQAVPSSQCGHSDTTADKLA